MSKYDSNSIALLRECELLKLIKDVAKIKKIIGTKSIYVNYYITVNGNYRIIAIKSNFIKILNSDEDSIKHLIESLNFEFVLKDEDSFKVLCNDFHNFNDFKSIDFNNSLKNIKNINNPVIILLQKMI